MGERLKSFLFLWYQRLKPEPPKARLELLHLAISLGKNKHVWAVTYSTEPLPSYCHFNSYTYNVVGYVQ